jgi:NADPH-dependent glutamate synthase beta subunit-like oxidoreductase/formate hydrogenlyase subunit 6/NADH:ubiquinone oxidoreductase subunit I
VSKCVLIIGGSPAGLQAALDLADAGIEVHLAENSPFIGKDQTAQIPDYLLNARALEIAKHPRVTLWTDTDLQHAERNGDSFQLKLRRHPRFVDLKTCTWCGDCIDVCPVTVPGTHHKAIHRLDGVQPQCAVIDKVGIAPCSSACPAGIHVQGYLALIAEERFQEAIDLVRQAIPFPGICGRICTHPCEAECRRTEIDEPVAIRQLKRFIADWEMKNAGNAPIPASKKHSPGKDAKRIAIVGAGPAGLTAAHCLAQKDFQMTVFEKLSIAGGMMAVGIPAFRLPKEILQAEITAIEMMGVDIKTGVTFGKDITLEELKSQGFQAVFLATGLHGSRKLGVVGEDLPGVIDGVSFLRDVALGKPVTLDSKVVVVGGGNVAMDVALTARRIGSDEVTIVCLETREEMPAWQFEIEEALEAGVEIVNCFGPNRFIEKNGSFAGIEFKRCTCVFDEHCNFNPQYDENDLNSLEAETVIIAIGQMALTDISEAEQIAHSPAGQIIADPMTLQTNIPWVFAGGDSVYGPKSVVEAIASGKQAAASIHRYLSGHDLKAGHVDNKSGLVPATATAENGQSDRPLKQEIGDNYRLPISQRPMTDDELLPKPRVPMPGIPLDDRLKSFAEVEFGYSAEQAVAEARRCLTCGPCSECMACVEACKPLAINHNQRPTAVELDVSAIIYADDPKRFEDLPLTADRGIYRVSPQDLLLSSAIAARAASDTRLVSYPEPFKTAPEFFNGHHRTGVFICQCGEAIAQTVDVEAVRRHTATLADVICVEILPFSCTHEAGQTISEMVSYLDLNQFVLAACACCSLDQVCYSCTFQRIRCKQNFGLFDPQLPTPRSVEVVTGECDWPIMAEFVNIREQCAWVHRDDPSAATSKATALIAAAVAKVQSAASKSLESMPIERSVLILGGGEAAGICQDHLQIQNIDVRQSKTQTPQIQRANGSYAIRQNGYTWTAASMVLAPRDPSEAEALITAFGTASHQPRIRSIWGGLETHLPGVFYCDPGADGSVAGAAAAARVSAWLGRCSSPAKSNVAVVEAHLCRACQSCVDTCEFGAPHIVGQEENRNAWVDPNICTGCGTCAALCPSGAITAGYASDKQLAAMIEAILADDVKTYENR